MSDPGNSGGGDPGIQSLVNLTPKPVFLTLHSSVVNYEASAHLHTAFFSELVFLCLGFMLTGKTKYKPSNMQFM